MTVSTCVHFSFGFSHSIFAGAQLVGLAKACSQRVRVARQSDNLHVFPLPKSQYSRKSIYGPSIKRPINSYACHTSIKMDGKKKHVTRIL